MKLYRMAYRVIFIGLLLLNVSSPSNSLIGQEGYSYNDKKLAKDSIEDLSNLAKYDDRERKLKPKKVNWETEEEEPPPNFNLGVGPIFTWFLYLMIGLLVAYILYVIFSNVKIDKKVDPKSIPIKEEIEDIEVIDSELGLRNAMEAGDYREAVRMLFIKLLQELVVEKSIDWKPEKTNRDYLREMKDHPKFRHFDNLVLAYEGIWYGSQEVDKLYFDYLKSDFEKFYSTQNVGTDGQK